MDKRLAKRHKRQVARAKEKVRISEPDVRTHEQIEAAREASRPDMSRGLGPNKVGPSGRSSRGRIATVPASAAKTDG